VAGRVVPTKAKKAEFCPVVLFGGPGGPGAPGGPATPCGPEKMKH